MAVPFTTAAVLGAGTMGAQIAAHLANAGLTVTLLDVTRDAAEQGLKRLRSIKPDPCFEAGVLTRISTGSFNEDAGKLKHADWVIEAVVESLDAKRALLTALAPHLAPTAIVSSNTSGIPLGSIATALPATMHPRWLGTHFFNPPRYLHLIELIPTPDTAPETLARIRDFADHHLGKGVVVAKDSSGFIANRIGMFAAARALDLVASSEFTIEEIDAITGPIMGRPKSATFRTMDIAGVDIVAKVAADLDYALPPFVATMVERGMLGDKTGRGFYQRIKGDAADSGSTILVLDPATLDYRPQQPVKLPALEAARTIADIGTRIRTLFHGSDRVGDALRRTLGPTLEYVVRIANDIAHDPSDIDRAMRWGFGWELGPFATIEAIGPPLKAAGAPAIAAPTKAKRVVKNNVGASLVDLGDDVLCIEFHSKLNTIGGDIVEMLQAGVSEAARNFAGLVVGNDAEHFSAGANLTLVLMEAQEGNWDEIDLMVRAFQRATMALKYSPVPVVSAPAGLALGGGCEICLHSARVRAAAETYIGLVEVGVGLLPAGGGTKEMLLRLPVQTAFETIGFAKVSTSGPDARNIGYLRAEDGVTMNRDRLMEDAKRDVLAMARAGYQAPAPLERIPVGGPDTFAALSLGVHLAHRAGRISDHDALIGRLVAHVLSGGAQATHRTTVSEQQLLDLEREAFLKLCGERKTLERMSYTLKTGKTLRN